MAGHGSAIPTQIVINSAVTILAKYHEQFSWSFTPDTYTAGDGTTKERGSGVATLSGPVWDYSALATLDGYMAAQTEVDAVVTFKDTGSATLNPVKVIVEPNITTVLGIKKVLIGASGASDNNLDAETGWIDMGRPVDESVQVAFSVERDTTGRLPYYTSNMVDLQMEFNDIQLSDVTGTHSVDDSVKIAIKFGGDVYAVFTGIRLDNIDQQFGNMIRTRVRCTGSAYNDTAAWSQLFAFHDGSSGAVTEPGDKRFGFTLTLSGEYVAAQSELLTIA